jgi:hypothetical protein
LKTDVRTSQLLEQSSERMTRLMNSICKIAVVLLSAEVIFSWTANVFASTNSPPANPSHALVQPDAFSRRLAELRTERGPKSYGRMTPEEQKAWIARIQGIAAKYEQFIAEHESHPRLSVAMSDLAEVYGALRTREGRPVGDSRKKSIEWYRKVIAAEEEGSKLWRDARFQLAAKLRSEKDKKSWQEARAITESMMKASAGDPIEAAKAKAQLVYQCIRENDFAKAETHCRELMSYKDGGKPRELQQYQSSAVNSLMQKKMYWNKVSLADKKKWLDEFSTTVASQDWLKDEVAMAHRQYATVEKMKPEAKIEVKPSHVRTGLILANVFAFAAFGFFVLRKRWSRRAATPGESIPPTNS